MRWASIRSCSRAEKVSPPAYRSFSQSGNGGYPTSARIIAEHHLNVFARRIVGWRVSSCGADFVLDALEQTIYDQCDHAPTGLSITVIAARISLDALQRAARRRWHRPSVGRGDSYDNARRISSDRERDTRQSTTNREPLGSPALIEVAKALRFLSAKPGARIVQWRLGTLLVRSLTNLSLHISARAARKS